MSARSNSRQSETFVEANRPEHRQYCVLQLNKYHASSGELAATAIVKIFALKMQVCTDKAMQDVGWSCKRNKIHVMEVQWVYLLQCCVM